MAGRSALWFWVPLCCFPPPPCGFLALITNLVQCEGQNFGKNSANTPLRESSDCFVEPTLFSVLLLHCFKSQSNSLFLTSKHVFPFCVQISFILQCFTSKRKRNTLKGFVNTTSGCACAVHGSPILCKRCKTPGASTMHLLPSTMELSIYTFK